MVSEPVKIIQLEETEETDAGIFVMGVTKAVMLFWIFFLKCKLSSATACNRVARGDQRGHLVFVSLMMNHLKTF